MALEQQYQQSGSVADFYKKKFMDTALSKPKEINQIKDYYESLIVFLQKPARHEYCEDLLLNSLLGHRIEECGEKQIKIHVHNQQLQCEQLSATEWMDLFYTLFDWIEVEGEQRGAEIWLYTDAALGRQLVQMTARFQKPSTQEKRVLTRRKRKLCKHLKKLAREHNGSYIETTEEGLMSIRIIL